MSTVDVDALVTEQNQLLDLVKKQLSNFKKDGHARKTKSYFSRRLGTLERHYNEFHANNILLLANLDPKDKYFTDNFLDTFEETHFDVTVAIQDACDETFPPQEPLNTTLNSSLRQSVDSQPRVRLPKINLPTFPGDCLLWPSFYDAFKTIDKDTNLTASQKFQYLKGCLTDQAELLVRHLPITDENYSKAKEELLKAYDNKRALFTQQMNAFLAQSDIKNENHYEIRQLLCFSRATMHVIEKLGVETSQSIFVHLILQKLPVETRMFCLQAFDSKTIPVWDDLERAIEIRLNSLPSTESKGEIKKYVSSKDHFRSNTKSSTTSSTFQKSNSLHVAKEQNCPHCGGSHLLRSCPSFLKLAVKDRKLTAEKFRHCFNCLGSNHLLNKCPSTRTCSTCSGRHHTLLHLPRSSDNPQNTSNSTNPPVQVSTVAHSINPSVNSHQILLATAIVKVRASNGELIPPRALLDQGSQATLITEDAVQRLRLPKSSIRASINGVGDIRSNHSKSLVSISIKSCCNNEFEFHTDALVLSRLTSKSDPIIS